MAFPRRFGPGIGFPGFATPAEEELLSLDNPPYERIANHGDEAVSWLLEQFKDKPRIEALVRALVAPVQRLEDVLWQVLTRVVDLAHAEGVHLDLFGRILRLPRAGLSDDDYRSRLRVWQLVLSSDGRAEQLIRIADLFDGVVAAGDWIMLDEGSPHVVDGMVITVEHLMEHSPVTLVRFLQRARAAGKSLQLIWEPSGPTEAFLFADAYDTEEVSAAGFSYDSEVAVGGVLADVRT